MLVKVTVFNNQFTVKELGEYSLVDKPVVVFTLNTDSCAGVSIKPAKLNVN